MSWFNLLRNRSFAFLALLVLAASSQAGCGFTPVYHQSAPQSVRESLALIDVAPIGGKSGWQLRNRLLEKFTPRGAADVPLYRLSVSLNSATEAVLIQLDNTATRHNLKMNASFTLIDLSTGDVAHRGTAISVGSYNVVDSEFATIAAENNARERTAREIGEEIFDLLVIYFNGAKS